MLFDLYVPIVKPWTNLLPFLPPLLRCDSTMQRRWRLGFVGGNQNTTNNNDINDNDYKHAGACSRSRVSPALRVDTGSFFLTNGHLAGAEVPQSVWVYGFIRFHFQPRSWLSEGSRGLGSERARGMLSSCGCFGLRALQKIPHQRAHDFFNVILQWLTTNSTPGCVPFGLEPWACRLWHWLLRFGAPSWPCCSLTRHPCVFQLGSTDHAIKRFRVWYPSASKMHAWLACWDVQIYFI